MTKSPFLDWSNPNYMMVIEKSAPRDNLSGFSH
jgi:hypothetical protein